MPAAATRVSAVLDAQADALRVLNPTQPRGALRCEAHRLGRSDLAIGCGTSGPSRAWWIAGASDLAVEAAVASGCGIVPGRLPALRQIARHELLPAFGPGAAAGSLGITAAPGWRASVAALGDGWRLTRATLAHDVPSVRRNVKRIPSFVARYAAIFGRSK